MKIAKISPLFLLATLLVGCSGNDVTTMKKPSFAKYSNAVTAEAFAQAEEEKLSALKDLFVTEGEGVTKTVKGLKNGFSTLLKSYSHYEVTGKNAGGLSMKHVTKSYMEQTEKVDKANKRHNTNRKSESVMDTKNGYGNTNVYAVEDGKVLVVEEPSYSGSTLKIVQKGQQQTQYEFDGADKMKEINVNEKTFDVDEITGFDFDSAYAKQSYQEMSQYAVTPLAYIDSYFKQDDVKYYVDGDILTVVAEKTFEGKTSSNGLDYNSKATASFIGQVDFAKLTSAYSNELTLEESTKNGTTKYVKKEYYSMVYTNKDVTIKAIDTAKFVDLDA